MILTALRRYMREANNMMENVQRKDESLKILKRVCFSFDDDILISQVFRMILFQGSMSRLGF